jgi:hypothetical protein
VPRIAAVRIASLRTVAVAGGLAVVVGVVATVAASGTATQHRGTGQAAAPDTSLAANVAHHVTTPRRLPIPARTHLRTRARDSRQATRARTALAHQIKEGIQRVVDVERARAARAARAARLRAAAAQTPAAVSTPTVPIVANAGTTSGSSSTYEPTSGSSTSTDTGGASGTSAVSKGSSSGPIGPGAIFGPGHL